MSGREGIPLRLAIGLGLAAVLAGAAALYAYYRSLAAAVLAAEPAAIDEVAPDAAALERALAEIDAARAARGRAALDERAANLVLFEEAIRDPARAVRLRIAEPCVRIALSQRDEASGKWLNADLLAAPYAGGGTLGFDILSGKVGAVSISRTEGEWVRERIERQLAFETASRERLRARLAGLREARVAGDRLVLGF